jgi:hypothetical protein
MASTPSSAVAASSPRPYFADLYTFDWTQASFRNSLTSSLAVLILLLGGVLAGHPWAGLIAGSGAMILGFGINQRISDSRLMPMIAATVAMFVSTFIGMWGGHHGYTLLLTSAVWAFVYGLLTAQAAGIAWVGQQAAVVLFVSSAFPAGFHDALNRASLTLAGCALQILITSAVHHLFPELWRDLRATPRFHRDLLEDLTGTGTLRNLHGVLPRIGHMTSFAYALRLTVTVVLAAELYRRLDIQSGYWIPMTALLVQKPAFFETFTRALLRVAGTLAGAVLCTHFLVHIHPTPVSLAILATLFAFLSFVTLSVNYGLYSIFLTGYIVFLLSLYAMPGAVIAHRRALCTLAGGLIALILHLDALYRHRERPSTRLA